MKNLLNPFQIALVAKRITTFEDDPPKGLYQCVEYAGEIYEKFLDGRFSIMKTPERIDSIFKSSTHLSIISRNRSLITCTSVIFTRWKLPGYFYAKNLRGGKNSYDFFLFDQEPENDLLNILITRDSNWKEWDLILNKFSDGLYYNPLREFLHQLKPITNNNYFN